MESMGNGLVLVPDDQRLQTRRSVRKETKQTKEKTKTKEKKGQQRNGMV